MQNLTGAQIGCDSDQPFHFSPASRDDSENQTFGPLRQGQSLTKDQRIAIQEHTEFHARLGDFGENANLQQHITLMILAIKNGLSFTQAHEWAITNGPKPDR